MGAVALAVLVLANLGGTVEAPVEAQEADAAKSTEEPDTQPTGPWRIVETAKGTIRWNAESGDSAMLEKSADGGHQWVSILEPKINIAREKRLLALITDMSNVAGIGVDGKFLGLRILTTKLEDDFGLFKGDLVLAANGKDVQGAVDMANALSEGWHGAPRSVTYRVKRGQGELDLVVRP
jgi:hypothetical protein